MNQHVTAELADPAHSHPADLEDVVRLVDLRRRFGKTAALDGVSLTVRKGEILGIIGRSGAGKSTLIRCLNGLERPDTGDVFIEGREIGRLGERELQPLRPMMPRISPLRTVSETPSSAAVLPKRRLRSTRRTTSSRSAGWLCAGSTNSTVTCWFIFVSVSAIRKCDGGPPNSGPPAAASQAPINRR